MSLHVYKHKWQTHTHTPIFIPGNMNRTLFAQLCCVQNGIRVMHQLVWLSICVHLFCTQISTKKRVNSDKIFFQGHSH